MDFRGLGLPTNQYSQFIGLINIASRGSASCSTSQGGMCVLPKSCDNYPSLWQYSFKVSFAQEASQYIILPLATFAANQV